MLKQAALTKYRETFGDGHMPAFRDDCESDWQAYADRFAQRVRTRQALASFWNDIRSLTWPETYGQTPWEFAGSAGYTLVQRCRQLIQ
jgi:hypothetical protein